jgi:hypothetical protein
MFFFAHPFLMLTVQGHATLPNCNRTILGSLVLVPLGVYFHKQQHI